MALEAKDVPAKRQSVGTPATATATAKVAVALPDLCLVSAGMSHIQ